MIANYFTDFNIYGYGLSSTDNKRRTVDRFGLDSGFRVLLYVDQPNYCGVMNKWHGAGFRAYIHDPDAVPQSLVDDFIYLSPGFQTDVVIKPTSFNKETESLGHCVNKVQLWLSPTKSKYIRYSCLTECVQFRVYENCKCMPNPSDYAKRMAAMKYKVKKVPDCTSGGGMECNKRTIMEMIRGSQSEICPQCKTPCVETKYEYQLTSSKLHPLFAEKMNITNNVSTVSKNYLLVRFAFESLTTLFVKETKSITLPNLVMYWGGLVGLFLGMSFISFYEIYHIIVINLLPKIKFIFNLTIRFLSSKICRKTKVNFFYLISHIETFPSEI